MAPRTTTRATPAPLHHMLRSELLLGPTGVAKGGQKLPFLANTSRANEQEVMQHIREDWGGGGAKVRRGR